MAGIKAAELTALRHRLALIERGGRAKTPVLPFGVAAIDAVLPGGGLALGALHEIGGVGAGEEEAAEATAFLAGILARLEPGRPVLWCLGQADLYAPGLAGHGLAPARLILARAGDANALLWAMEEGLKCRALAAVVGEAEAFPGVAGRRLQLAAESSGVTAFVVRRRHAAGTVAEAPTASVTRWRIAARPTWSPSEACGIGRPRWMVELLRCRGGLPGQWMVEASDATGHVHLAGTLADRSASQQRRAAG